MSETGRLPGDRPPGRGRIESFVDGVVAIIITITVLALKVPSEAFVKSDFHAAMDDFGPRLAIYALSFVVIAIMLLDHHMPMRLVLRATTTRYWWNAHLLFWMSLIPLCTAAPGENPLAPMAAAFYGAVLAANAISFTLLHRSAASLAERTWCSQASTWHRCRWPISASIPRCSFLSSFRPPISSRNSCGGHVSADSGSGFGLGA